MFCSNCGAEVSGNFCSKCGSAVRGAASSNPETPHDWSSEVNYEKLISIPEVRNLIVKHASMAEKHLSSEEFLALADNVIPLGVPLEKIVAVTQPVYAHLGLKTGGEHSETLSGPVGTIIVSALCSLARHGQVLKHVQQFDDGCLLEATLPSDMWSFEGTLSVNIHQTTAGTRIDGSTKIKGQIYDWGKSKRCLEALFDDMKAIPT